MKKEEQNMTNYRYLYLVIFLFGILTYGLGLAQPAQAKQNQNIMSNSFNSQVVNKARYTLSDETNGRMFLSSEDDFTSALSEFDLQARMKSLEKVSKAEYLKFAGAAARNWTPDERQKMMKAASKLQAELDQFSISLPDEILIIKTSGAEEGNGAYTRRNAIILPEDYVKKTNDVQMEALLTHETWHVISRYNPELKLRMYAAMGFTPCSVQFPQALLPLKITNPDAISYSYCYQVTRQGKPVKVAPFQYATKPYDDGTKRKEFFQYITSVMNAVNRKHEAVMVPSLLEVGGANNILNVWDVEGFDVKTFGTGYLIHPEEITAEHFVKILKKDFTHPLTEKLAKELQTTKKS
ncbi:MAG TPA: hypothetical protein VLR90_22705 [Blastocatellia bacterium]|nr:hypothetical protein [Blastocatellia bacterium]